MNILITGSEGYIGSKLQAELRSLGHNIYCIDLKNGLDLVNFKFYKKVDFVFHLAALPSVKFSVENPSYALGIMFWLHQKH